MSRRRPQPHLVNPSGLEPSVDTTTQMLLAEAQALSARLAALNEVAVAMQRIQDRDALLHTMADQARWVLDFQLCTIIIVEEGQLREQVLRQTGAVRYQAGQFAHRSAIEQVLLQRVASLIPTIPPEAEPPAQMAAALLLPLIAQDRLLGTLNFYTNTPNHYRQDDLRIATALSTQVAAILANTQLLVATRQARDELHTVVESIGDGVLVLDHHGRLLLSNRALQQMLRLSQPPVIGIPVWQLFEIATANQPDPVDEQALLTLSDVLRQPLGHAEPLNGTLVLFGECYTAWVAAPLSNGEGLVFTIRDVTAQIQLEQLRDDMVRMLVHDFRTPLTSMFMAIDMLDMYADPQQRADHRAMTDIVRRSTHALLDQVNTLLDVSKMEAGRLELELGPVALREVLTNAQQAVIPIIQHNEQTVELDLPIDLPIIEADYQLVRRIIDNLLGNALKFTPNRGQIILAARLMGDQIECTIQDSGPGIPPDQRPTIFEKYAQVKGQKQTRQRGTGLGLTFCRLAVEAHGGKIGIRDAPQRGSIFWFTLPLRRSGL